MADKPYFTYVHIRVNEAGEDEVFYVGKGSGKRAADTFNRPAAWFDKIQNGFKFMIVERYDTESEAIIAEEELIRSFLASGVPIINKYIGDRNAGKTDEELSAIRQKQSQSRIKKYEDPDFHKSQCDILEEIRNRPGYKEKLSQSRHEFIQSEEGEAWRQSISNSKKKRCTIDGWNVFNSVKELTDALGKSARKHPNFRFVD